MTGRNEAECPDHGESSPTSGSDTLPSRYDGTTVTSTTDPDPVWGMTAPSTQQVRFVYPSGRASHSTVSRTAAPLDPLQLFGPASRTETRVVNGRTTTESFNANARTLTITSPQHRVATSSRNTPGTLLQRDAAWTCDAANHPRRAGANQRADARPSDDPTHDHVHARSRERLRELEDGTDPRRDPDLRQSQPRRRSPSADPAAATRVQNVT